MATRSTIRTVRITNMEISILFRQAFALSLIMYIRVQVNNFAKRQFVQIDDVNEITISKFIKKGNQ